LINAKNEFEYIRIRIRSLLGFKVRSLYFFLKHSFDRGRTIDEYLKDHPVRKLQIGSATDIDGFLNSQILGAVPFDASKKNWPFPDNSFDIVFSSHVFEHLYRNEMKIYLEEAYRTLRTDGVCIVACPSVELISSKLYNGIDSGANIPQQVVDRANQYYESPIFSRSHVINLAMRGFGHAYLVDREFVEKLGRSCGFKKLVDWMDLAPQEIGLSNYFAKKPYRWHWQTDIYCLQK